jgi:hypothetical protein
MTFERVTADQLTDAYDALEAVYDGLDDDEITTDERDALRDALDLLESWATDLP